MAWGAKPAGLADLNVRIAKNDPALTSLHIMRFRRVEDEDVKGLCAALASNTALTELSCSCHPLSAASAACFGEALAANATLQSVSIGNSGFGDAGMAALAAGLAANRGLTRLDLENKGITAAGAQALRACLEAHPKLRDLTLSRNALGAAGAAALCVPWRQLRALDLSVCSLDAAAITALAAAPSLGTLHALSLGGNELGPAGGEPLAALLSAATGLRSLDLRGCSIGPEGTAGFAPELSKATALTSLKLGDCAIGAAGCAALAAALQQRAQAGGGGGLQRLVMGPGNDLGDGDVCTLAQALAAASAAEGGQGLKLDLSGASLEAAGASALSRIPRLRSLVLFGASLSAEAAAALTDALAERGGAAFDVSSAAAAPFSDLEELNLCGCRLETPALRQLLGALDVGPQDGPLRLVEVGANPGADDPEFQEAASELRERRPKLDVHWRAADGSSGGDGGGGGGPPRPDCP